MALSNKHLRLFDRLGFSASTLCAIHCAAMPFAVSILPALGLTFLDGGAFELVMIATSIVIASFSLGSSYRLHGRLNALMIMTSGGMLLIFNFFGHESHSPLVETLHPYLAALGGLMIASAHWINMRLCKSCEVCEHDHEHGHSHEHHTHGDHTHGDHAHDDHAHASAEQGADEQATERSDTHVHADGRCCSVDHEAEKNRAASDITFRE